MATVDYTTASNIIEFPVGKTGWEHLDPKPPEKPTPLYHVGEGGCWGVALYLTRRLKTDEGLSSSVVKLPDGTIPEKDAVIVCGSCGGIVEADHENKMLVGLNYTQSIPSPAALQHLMSVAIGEHARLHHDAELT